MTGSDDLFQLLVMPMAMPQRPRNGRNAESVVPVIIVCRSHHAALLAESAAANRRHSIEQNV